MRHYRRRRPRHGSWLLAIYLVVCGLLLPREALSQTLVTTPKCAQAGTSVQIGGSGWAEPAPVCEYLFKFDGAEFAPRQPDGLFGPPNRAVIIPANASAGQHTIKVELRLTSNGTLLQCRQVPFRVVTAIEDPWDGEITTSGPTIVVGFDPENVCDVEACSKIVMIQVIRMLGEMAAGGTRVLNFQEQGFPNPSSLQTDVTASGYTVDYVTGEADPYYNGDDAGDLVQQGLQNGMPITSIIEDTPGRPDSAYPSGIVKIILEFEVAVFCAQGQGKGKFLGTMTWRWERPIGGAATATSLSTSRNPPSASFTSALNLWNANHSFTLPSPGTPTTGGQPCN